MAAPKGNQYWLMRGKHGRDRVIKSPEALLENSNEYFQWCLDNPLLVHDYRGKDPESVYLEKPRPFKKEEFARFCGLSQWKEINSLKDVSEDFAKVLTYIEKTIADQKFDYAAIGVFNANIIARDLQLVNREDITSNNETLPIFPNVSTNNRSQ